MHVPKAVLFDIGSTLWSSPAEDLGSLARCYGRAHAIILAAGLPAPPVDALIEAVEGHFARWEDIWRTEPGRVEQPATAEYVAEALAKIDVKLDAKSLAAFT